jgi:energy-coupling factor transporter ATP-binding protein EcfA2
MTVAPGFPTELLTRPLEEKLAYFRGYTVAHPLLVEAKDKLMSAISESEPNSLVFVFGPTGVGKTTLRIKVEQVITNNLRSDLEQDRGRMPVVGVEAIAPESGRFSWSDHFRRLLLSMNEPLIESKRDPETLYMRQCSTFGSKATIAEYRYAVEQALRFRRPAAVMIDEAQHLSKMASGRRLLDQLDVVKSIANQTRIVHVLFGTYDLLAFRNLNGQLSRRSLDVHFPRYRAESVSERQVFINILRSFAHHMPLPEPPDLAAEWEFLYERSMGCVGILKQWLTRAIHSVLRCGGNTINRNDLENQALSVLQCQKILSETAEGELQSAEPDEARRTLRCRLGLQTGVVHEKDSAKVSRPTTVRNPKRRPGVRRPQRDRIGAAVNGAL